MQRLEVSGAVRPLYGSLGVKGLTERTVRKKPADFHGGIILKDTLYEL
jgi:hypothetical protein